MEEENTKRRHTAPQVVVSAKMAGRGRQGRKGGREGDREGGRKTGREGGKDKRGKEEECKSKGKEERGEEGRGGEGKREKDGKPTSQTTAVWDSEKVQQFCLP